MNYQETRFANVELLSGNDLKLPVYAAAEKGEITEVVSDVYNVLCYYGTIDGIHVVGILHPCCEDDWIEVAHPIQTTLDALEAYLDTVGDIEAFYISRAADRWLHSLRCHADGADGETPDFSQLRCQVLADQHDNMYMVWLDASGTCVYYHAYLDCLHYPGRLDDDLRAIKYGDRPVEWWYGNSDDPQGEYQRLLDSGVNLDVAQDSDENPYFLSGV